jgi:hypothetical protein
LSLNPIESSRRNRQRAPRSFSRDGQRRDLGLRDLREFCRLLSACECGRYSHFRTLFHGFLFVVENSGWKFRDQFVLANHGSVPCSRLGMPFRDRLAKRECTRRGVAFNRLSTLDGKLAVEAPRRIGAVTALRTPKRFTCNRVLMPSLAHGAARAVAAFSGKRPSDGVCGVRSFTRPPAPPPSRPGPIACPGRSRFPSVKTAAFSLSPIHSRTTKAIARRTPTPSVSQRTRADDPTRSKSGTPPALSVAPRAPPGASRFTRASARSPSTRLWSPLSSPFLIEIPRRSFRIRNVDLRDRTAPPVPFIQNTIAVRLLFEGRRLFEAIG